MDEFNWLAVVCKHAFTKNYANMISGSFAKSHIEKATGLHLPDSDFLKTMVNVGFDYTYVDNFTYFLVVIAPPVPGQSLKTLALREIIERSIKGYEKGDFLRSTDIEKRVALLYDINLNFQDIKRASLISKKFRYKKREDFRGYEII